MKNNKKFFSYSLFKEGLRQTRVMGILGFIIIFGLTVLIWLGCASSSSFLAVDGELYGAKNEVIYGVEVASVLLLQYCLMSPLMTLYLFRFLNRRDASDVYHALPFSRECLHLSYFGAVMTWNALITVVTMGTVLLLYGVTPGLVISVSQMFCFALNVFSAQFTVAAGVLLAMSITGTAFSNVAISVLVLFLPRVVLTALAGMMNEASVIVDIFRQFPLLDPALNVVAGIPITTVQVFTNSDGLLNCLTKPMNGVYTLFLGVVLFAAALWILHHRKSETAGKSSPGHFLQGVYRVALGSFLGLLPMYLVFNAVSDESFNGFSDWVVIFILVFFVAIGYFLFELLTTKKAMNMVKAIPTFGLVLVINGLFLGLVLGLSSGLLHYLPTGEEIETVYIIEEDEQYFQKKIETVPITDLSARTLVSHTLQNTIKQVERGELHKDYGYFYGSYHSDLYRSMNVCMVTNRGKQYRNLLISNDEYDYLMDILEQQERFKQTLYDIPTPETHTMVIDFYSFGGYEPSVEDTKELYKVMVQEIQAMPFEQWYPMAMGKTNNGKISAFSITATVDLKGEQYRILFPITKPLFPKTFDLYMEQYNEKNPNGLEEFKKEFDAQAADGKLYTDYDVYATVLHPIEETMYTNDWVQTINQLWPYVKPYTPGTEDVVVQFVLNVYDWKGEYQTNGKSDAVFFTVERQYIDQYLEETYVVYD